MIGAKRFWASEFFKRLPSQNGMSLVELTVGMAIGSIVVFGASTVIVQINSMSAQMRLQAAVDQSYFNAVHVAVSPQAFSKIIHAPTMSPALRNCLASAGTGCRAFASTPPQPLSGPGFESLNAIEGPNGRCNANAAGGTSSPNDNHIEKAPAPGCVIQRQATYAWDCPTDNYCSGARTTISVNILRDTNGKLPAHSLHPRQGTFSIANRMMQSKGQLSFSCAASGSLPIYAIDFTQPISGTQNDQCSNYNAGASCQNAIRIYGGASAANNCQAAQSQTCATGTQVGFSAIGMYSVQGSCAPALPVALP